MTAPTLERPFQPGEIAPSEYTVTPEKVSLDSMRRFLKGSRMGIPGPEPKGDRYLPNTSLLEHLPEDIKQWDGAVEVVESASKTFSKLLRREPNQEVNRTDALSEQLSDSMAEIIRIAQYPESAVGRKTIINLIQANGVEYARHYFSPNFIQELQDIAVEQPAMSDRIGHFFTPSELFRRGAVTRNMIEDTKRSVEKAAEIASDRTAYLEQLLTSKPNDTFVDGLNDGVLLTLTTRQPASVDKALIQAAELFDVLALEYPDITNNKPTYVIRQLIKSDATNRLDAVRLSLDGSMRIYQELIEDGMSEQSALGIATNGSFGRRSEVQRARAAASHSVMMKPYGNKVGELGSVQDRKQRADERGVLQPKDAAALIQGSVEYRDLLFDIDESPEVSDSDERELLDKIYAIRTHINRFRLQFDDVLGRLSLPFQRGFEERFTEVLYALKYIIDQPDQPVVVPMGSKRVEVSLGVQDIARSLTFLEAVTCEMAAISPREQNDASMHSGVELGYVEGTRDSMMLLTKPRRSASIGPVERGKSSRINFIVGMGGIVPSAIANEREQACASLRIDQAEDGAIDIDIGGKTDNPYTPDFMIAKTVSLGAWYRSQLKGGQERDYHVSIDHMNEDEFAVIVDRLRQAIPLSATPLRIPSGH